MVTDRFRTLTTRFDSHEFRRLEREGGLEFVGGCLVSKRVSIESCRVETNVAMLLWNAATETRTASVFSSGMGYMCFPSEPNRVRKPSISLVRAERLAGIDPQDPFLTMPPDLAVEVVTGRAIEADLGERIDEYLSNGFPLVWAVRPNTRSVAVHRSDGSTVVLRGTDEITGEAALPGFKCPVADFFGPAR